MNTNIEVTHRGRVLLLLGVLATFAAWINKGNSVRVASAVLLAPLLIDLLWGGLRLPPMQLILRRRRTQSGAPFIETFTLHNLSPYRSVVDLHVREPRTDTYSGGLFIHHLGPNQAEGLKVPARTRSRGRAFARSVIAISSYPLGLIRRTTILRAETEIVSEPSRMPLPHHILHALEHESQLECISSTGEDEFHSLRDYTTGESARLVHAMRSAATGTLIRRVLHTQRQRQSCLILDMRRPPGRSARLGSRRLEWSLGATATVIDARVQEGSSITCLVIADTDKCWTLTTAEQYEEFLAYLAEAHPVVHRNLSQDFLGIVDGFETCLWVPAGGFKATLDRAIVREPILVTEWEDLP
jgi:uncharacterized protein (DUF58 family)